MKIKGKKYGISLIVLIITIVVLSILAATVILTISDNNPVSNASKAKFQTDLKAIQDELDLYEADQQADKIPRGETYTPVSVSGSEMTELFKSTKNYEDKIKIEDGKVVLISEKTTEEEKEWADELGISYISDENINIWEEDFTIIE